MAKVTFVAHQGNPDELLKTVFVRLYDMAGQQILSDEFILGVADIDIKILDIPPGEYMVWARAEGTQFMWRQVIEVLEVDPYQVITLVGTKTYRQENHHSVLVYGWVSAIAPHVRAGKHAVSHSSVIYGGFSRVPAYANHDITFRMLHDGSQANGILMKGDTLRVGYDANGYFEVELKPDSVYEVMIPGSPTRKMKTQMTGTADVRERISSVANTHLYKLA